MAAVALVCIEGQKAVAEGVVLVTSVLYIRKAKTCRKPLENSTYTSLKLKLFHIANPSGRRAGKQIFGFSSLYNGGCQKEVGLRVGVGPPDQWHLPHVCPLIPLEVISLHYHLSVSCSLDLF